MMLLRFCMEKMSGSAAHLNLWETEFRDGI